MYTELLRLLGEGYPSGTLDRTLANCFDWPSYSLTQSIDCAMRGVPSSHHCVVSNMGWAHLIPREPDGVHAEFIEGRREGYPAISVCIAIVKLWEEREPQRASVELLYNSGYDCYYPSDRRDAYEVTTQVTTYSLYNNTAVAAPHVFTREMYDTVHPVEVEVDRARRAVERQVQRMEAEAYRGNQATPIGAVTGRTITRADLEWQMRAVAVPTAAPPTPATAAGRRRTRD